MWTSEIIAIVVLAIITTIPIVLIWMKLREKKAMKKLRQKIKTKSQEDKNGLEEKEEEGRRSGGRFGRGGYRRGSRGFAEVEKRKPTTSTTDNLNKLQTDSTKRRRLPLLPFE